MNLEILKQLIHTRFPDLYTEEGINKLDLEKNPQDPQLRNALETFLDQDTLPNIEIAGYTVQKLKEEHHMNEIAAILTLDWLKCEPGKALESLKKGHDFIKRR